MMTNLFSIFDPSLYIFSFSWLICLFFFVFLPSMYWLVGSFFSFYLYLFSFFLGEVKSGLFKVSKGFYKFMVSVFGCLLMYNFLAIFPFIFSLTSHLLVTFPLAYSFWFAIVLFFVINFFRDFLIHLIPLGTPLGLVSFMVVVELLSNFIRPLALTFRLTANMMAGHLLMSLIGSFVLFLGGWYILLGSVFQMLLVFMELGVSVIQAYVFSTLLLLYHSEGSSH